MVNLSGTAWMGVVHPSTASADEVARTGFSFVCGASAEGQLCLVLRMTDEGRHMLALLGPMESPTARLRLFFYASSGAAVFCLDRGGYKGTCCNRETRLRRKFLRERCCQLRTPNANGAGRQGFLAVRRVKDGSPAGCQRPLLGSTMWARRVAAYMLDHRLEGPWVRMLNDLGGVWGVLLEAKTHRRCWT